jgi:D-glycero-alpha-D-manno-heptose-7-phosphate kinase
MVCHLAVEPGAEVLADRRPPARAGIGAVQLHLPSFDDHYGFRTDEPPGRHPLLEAALRRWAPTDCQLEVTLSSPVPPGSGLGTSASVVVALIAALQAVGGSSPEASQLAQAAHEVETVDLARQSGIQDQIAAAFGGANFVSIVPYPQFEVRSLEIPAATWAELHRRVITVYLGARHDSSAIHNSVIDRLGGAGAGTDRLMAPLRAAAQAAATALISGDLDSYGQAMIANTEAQIALHPDLVSPAAREVIELSDKCGALGWKVNGAGGYGGTVTVLGPEDPGELQNALADVDVLTLLPLQPTSHGARIVDRG